MRGFSKSINAMQESYLGALQRRVDRDPAGEIVLPVGVVNTVDVRQALRALQKAGSIGSPQSVSAPLPGLTHRGDGLSAPAVKSAKNGVGKSSEIKGKISVVSAGRSTSPLNLVGGGTYRFDGAAARDRRQIAAAIDAEIGVGAVEPVVSRDGVRCFVIPRRLRR